MAAARAFAIEAARHFAATRCQNVVVMDMAGLSPVTDYLVIGTGTSPRQMRSVCDQLEDLAAPKGHVKLSRTGDDSGAWIVIDFVDVVCHVFSPESRGYYDLDNLWGDAKRVEWQAPSTTPG
jgi:ribosome-associated protein